MAKCRSRIPTADSSNICQWIRQWSWRLLLLRDSFWRKTHEQNTNSNIILSAFPSIQNRTDQSNLHTPSNHPESGKTSHTALLTADSLSHFIYIFSHISPASGQTYSGLGVVITSTMPGKKKARHRFKNGLRFGPRYRPCAASGEIGAPCRLYRCRFPFPSSMSQ